MKHTDYHLGCDFGYNEDIEVIVVSTKNLDTGVIEIIDESRHKDKQDTIDKLKDTIRKYDIPVNNIRFSGDKKRQYNAFKHLLDNGVIYYI